MKETKQKTKDSTAVKDLKAAPYNPRKISEERLAMLKKSMEEFGDLSGIVFNVRSGQLIGGHQRVKVFDPKWPLAKMPYKDKRGTVAIGSVETPYGEWMYREVDWGEKKEKAANIAANKHGGDFDLDSLRAIAEELKIDGFNLELAGFDQNELFAFQLSDTRMGMIDGSGLDTKPGRGTIFSSSVSVVQFGRLLAEPVEIHKVDRVCEKIIEVFGKEPGVLDRLCDYLLGMLGTR